MEKKYENLNRTASRIGKFGDYEMFGLQFENASGERGWLVTAWFSGRDPVRTFWVEGEEIVRARGHWAINFSDRSLIETFPGDPDMEPEMRKAILQGIAEWEKTAET